VATVHTNGVELRVNRYWVGPRDEDRPVVVFVHGLGIVDHSGLSFTLGMPLANVADVVLYALRGHGRSEVPPTGYRLDDHVADLAGLLDALMDREAERALMQLAPVLPQDLGEGEPRDLLLAGLRGYLEAVRTDPVTWRLVLMPQEGAPVGLRERIARGRAAVLAQLTQTFQPGFGPGRELRDPELAAHMLSTLSDEAARLLLTQPDRFPVERLLAFAEWMLDQLTAPR
jgi:pimeloyl-ACP methyl ester carboxylesterase